MCSVRVPSVGGMGIGDDGQAWYVAYGSNQCRDRLLAYLDGTVAPIDGAPAAGMGAPGSASARYGPHRDCADATPPSDDRWIELDRPLRFRGTSPRWGGAVAFLDLEPRPGTATPARAWLLGVDQILGIVAQESRRPDDVPRSVLADLAPGAWARVGTGRYDALLRLDDLEGRLALTVTTTRTLAHLPEGEPVPAYLATIAAGRAERPPEAR